MIIPFPSIPCVKRTSKKGGFFKWGICKSPWLSIRKLSNFGRIWGTPSLGNPQRMETSMSLIEFGVLTFFCIKTWYDHHSMNWVSLSHHPIGLNCDFIPYIHHGFWGCLISIGVSNSNYPSILHSEIHSEIHPSSIHHPFIIPVKSHEIPMKSHGSQ